MKRQISPRDFETLSAYLDNQLAAQERANLEKRMERNEDLRAAFEELRRLHSLLRTQPKLHAPRNFTLTPQMVKLKTGKPIRAEKRPKVSAYPALRVAFAMAVILLVLVTAGDLLLTRLQPASMPVALYQESAPATELSVGGGGMESEPAAEESLATVIVEAQVERPEAPTPTTPGGLGSGPPDNALQQKGFVATPPPSVPTEMPYPAPVLEAAAVYPPPEAAVYPPPEATAPQSQRPLQKLNHHRWNIPLPNPHSLMAGQP